MKKELTKNELMDSMRDAGRNLSGVTVQFHHLVSEKIGLSGGDHKYLDILLQHGPMTAGKMSELSGLTTGAITAVIDRLERQNYIKRERDPDDRRKVIVVPNRELAMEQLGPIFKTLLEHMAIINSKFSLEELKTINTYLESSIEVFTKMIDGLKKNQLK